MLIPNMQYDIRKYRKLSESITNVVYYIANKSTINSTTKKKTVVIYRFTTVIFDLLSG